MVGLRFADMRLRPTEFLDFTSLTVEEFQILIPPFEAAFQAHMAVWCLDGTARTARRFSVYQTCPLATPEDRLFFLLTYLKTYTLQVVQRTPVRDVFGMGQSKANQWIHVLLPALLAALRDLGAAPTRSLTALARRLGVPEAAAVVAVSPEKPQPVSPPLSVPVARPLFPLLPMTGRNGASSAPKTLLNRRNVTVARKRITR
jgi:hypothetical protein